MTENKQIQQLETKINQIQNIINNWEKETMNYKANLQKIIEEVSQLKTNANTNIK